ncbi:MAG: hypothetical protein LH650_13135, partial [Chloroflexi bacterium]|nr:hypothetical protein [Chloroflexota bacterium]
MGGENDRCSCRAGSIDQHGQEVASSERVKCRQRFVEQPYRRAGAQNEGEHYLGLLATAQPSGPPPHRQAQGREPLHRGIAVEARSQLLCEVDVLRDRQAPLEGHPL